MGVLKGVGRRYNMVGCYLLALSTRILLEGHFFYLYLSGIALLVQTKHLEIASFGTCLRASYVVSYLELQC